MWLPPSAVSIRRMRRSGVWVYFSGFGAPRWFINRKMSGFGALLVSAVACFSIAIAAVPADEVTSLPGWSGPLPTRQYSGYLSPFGNTTKRFHYWFVESANDPANDPVVLWLNGGPGCSSLEGYLKEQGPLHFDPANANSSLPLLMENPYAWNRIANVIFLESPVGVGFSYSSDPHDYSMDDHQTALDNYGVLVSFFGAYPEFRENDFYISGESYAGIYVPTLVNTVMSMNKDPGKDFINLKGFLVGNGCIGNKVGSCSFAGLETHLKFYYEHALISMEMYDKIVAECGNFMNASQSCSMFVAEALQTIGNVNIYDIYEPCIGILPKNTVPRMRNYLKEFVLSHNPGTYYGPDGCIDDRVTSEYLNSDPVRSAIHVESAKVTGTWRVCTNKINYVHSIDSLLPIYPTLIKKYRALIYNGDVDGCVPYTGDEMWTSGLNLPVKEAWRSWSVDDQIAGYVTEYDYNDFKFVTVKGSGHMVPQFRPKQAFAMFERFIKDIPF